MLAVKNSILRSLKVIVVSLLFVWLAWTFLIPGDDVNKAIAWGCFCFFFATFFNGVYHLVDRRAKILIDTNGIYFPGSHRSIIDWSEIKEFEIERNKYQDIVWIELKRGEFLHLKMFYLDIPPEVLHKHVESCMRRAAGLPDREELRRNAGKKGLADFVEPAGNKYIADNYAEKSVPENSGRVEAQNPGVSVFSSATGQLERSEKPENAADALNGDSKATKIRETDVEDVEIKLNSLSNTIDKKIAAKVAAQVDKSLRAEDEQDEDAEDVAPSDDSILTQQWQIPQWFSDEPVTNEIIWTGVLNSTLCVILFAFAYLEGDPPKISLAEQIMAIVAFGILGPPFLFFISFCRGTDLYRNWAGLSAKQSVSYSVKAKKITAAGKPQKSGGSPRKVRSKKKRR